MEIKMKSTRAFRNISEAAEELGLQPHVLRFWESKFPQIQPMKRRGGRRHYRPEDIELLRGIKILLHNEKHPIKDVQKLIRIKGVASVQELGRKAAEVSKPKDIRQTDLLPRRIKPIIGKKPDTTRIRTTEPPARQSVQNPAPEPEFAEPSPAPVANTQAKENLQDALKRLQSLKSRWQEFKE